MGDSLLDFVVISTASVAGLITVALIVAWYKDRFRR